MQAKETTVQQLLTGTKVFLVPLFQRRYEWGLKDWRALWDDLIEQYDELADAEGSYDGDGHFLGSIVLHPAPGPASTVARYLVVDGQQRLTTLMCLIAAIRDVRKEVDASWEPSQHVRYDHQYLGNPFNAEQPHRLVPTEDDKEAFVATVQGGNPLGQVGACYVYFSRELRKLAKEPGLDFERFDRALFLRLLLVDITTSPTDNVNHIFETLNYSGKKLSPLDLIRNHVFMQLPPDEAGELHGRYWKPMERTLEVRNLQRYIWASLVRSDPNASQKDLYPSFERRMRHLLAAVPSDDRAGAVQLELTKLHDEHHVFQAILDPSSSNGDSVTPAIGERLASLHSWGSQAHYPLTFALLVDLRAGRYTEASVLAALAVIESYMVRRGLAGVPTNNLNRILSSVPAQLDDRDPADALTRILSTGQRYWPTDQEVRRSAESVSLYRSTGPAQVVHILATLERVLRDKETPELTAVQVEHVLPQTLSPEWRSYLAARGQDAALTSSLVHTLGNLTLTAYNPELSNDLFAEKREVLAASGFALNTDISRYPEWGADEIKWRAGELAEMSCNVWARPTATGAGDEYSVTSKGLIEDALLAVPANRWVTLSTLARFAVVGEEDVRTIAKGLGSALAMKILNDDGSTPSWMPAATETAALSYWADQDLEVSQITAPELSAALFPDSGDADYV